jgi:hypothetical protein
MSLVLSGSTSGSVTLQEPAIAGTTVLDLPATSGNVVVDSATQTLTNKTLTSPTFGGTPTGVGVLTSGTAVASTSGTSIDFTSIPSWVKRITVMFSDVSTSGTSHILIRLGDAGGIETTGYTSISSAGSTTVNSTAGFIIRVTANTNTFFGSMVISNITGNNWVEQGGFLGVSSGGEVRSTAGGKTLSDVLTQLRITTVNGTDTFDAGSINILYE